MMGHNISFEEEIWKIIPFTPSYLEHWIWLEKEIQTYNLAILRIHIHVLLPFYKGLKSVTFCLLCCMMEYTKWGRLLKVRTCF